jgi:hypothetical protein
MACAGESASVCDGGCHLPLISPVSQPPEQHTTAGGQPSWVIVTQDTTLAAAQRLRYLRSTRA